MPSREKGEMHLFGVSREASKLSQVINSVPKATNFHEQSLLVGNDLLKGALDLQDSLIALGKLHETTKEMIQTKKFVDRIRREPEESSQINSNEGTSALLSKNCINSVSRRSCIEELKEVIKDSLCRQSFLSISSDDYEASFSRPLSYTAISRHKSFREIKPRKGSNTFIEQDTKATSPNLIAKLMGLEYIPGKTIQLLQVENESKRSSDTPRLASKIDHPNERKPALLKNKQNMKWGTTQDITGRGQINACKVMSDTSDTSLPDLRGKRSKVTEEGRWIMNTKALYCSKRENFQELQLLSNKNSKQELIGLAQAVSDTNVLPVEIGDILVGSTEKTIVDLSPRNKEDHTMVKLKSMPYYEGEEVQEDCIDHTFLKQELEQSIELAPECISLSGANEQPRERNRIVGRRLEKTKVEPSAKIQKSCNLCHRPNKKEAVGSWKQQMSGVHEKISAKPIECKVRPAQLSLIKTEKKMAVISDKGKATAGSTVLRQVEAQKKQNATAHTNSTARNSRIPLPENKIMIEPTNRSMAMKLIRETDSKTISASCKADASDRNRFRSVQHLKQRKHKLESSGSGKLRQGQKMINEVMPKVSKIRNPNKFVQLCHNKVCTEGLPGMDFKGLLLNSGLFLVHAFELCIHAHRDVHNENKKLDEYGRNTELYLDCAEELMARQRYHLELSKHPMLWIGLQKLSVCSTPDRIVEAINEGLITLTNYSKVSNRSLYIRLEKDLKCKESMLNGMWDVGW